MTTAQREHVAMAIYCDGAYRPYTVGADPDRWAKTSETQRQFCRLQAEAAVTAWEAVRL